MENGRLSGGDGAGLPRLSCKKEDIEQVFIHMNGLHVRRGMTHVTGHHHRVACPVLDVAIPTIVLQAKVRPIPVSGISRYSPVSVSIGIGRYLF